MVRLDIPFSREYSQGRKTTSIPHRPELRLGVMNEASAQGRDCNWIFTWNRKGDSEAFFLFNCLSLRPKAALPFSDNVLFETSPGSDQVALQIVTQNRLERHISVVPDFLQSVKQRAKI